MPLNVARARASGPPYWLAVPTTGSRLLVLALAAPTIAGTVFAAVMAALSVMAFDAPGSESRYFPYMIVVGCFVPAMASVGLLVNGLRLATVGRLTLACANLAFPPLYALCFLLWLRFS